MGEAACRAELSRSWGWGWGWIGTATWLPPLGSRIQSQPKTPPHSDRRANNAGFSHHHRHEAPPPPSAPYKHAPTPMPRLLPPRSPPFSSSVSAVSRRSLVSPRLVASCLSGMLKQQTANAPLKYRARTFPRIIVATDPTKNMETIEDVIV